MGSSPTPSALILRRPCWLHLIDILVLEKTVPTQCVTLGAPLLHATARCAWKPTLRSFSFRCAATSVGKSLNVEIHVFFLASRFTVLAPRRSGNSALMTTRVLDNQSCTKQCSPLSAKAFSRVRVLSTLLLQADGARLSGVFDSAFIHRAKMDVPRPRQGCVPFLKVITIGRST